jgi:thymidylate kinase
MSRYILVDGSDGTGKTTFCNNLSDNLSSSKTVHFPTRLPDEDDLSSPTTEVLFYLNDFDEFLCKKSHQEHTLILDRSFISTLAYQGFEKKGFKKREWAVESILGMGPEMVMDRDEVYVVRLHCSVQERMKRLINRKEDEDRVGELDREGLEQKLKELDRTFERSYSLLKNRCPEFTYLALDSTQKRPQRLCEAAQEKIS